MQDITNEMTIVDDADINTYDTNSINVYSQVFVIEGDLKRLKIEYERLG